MVAYNLFQKSKNCYELTKSDSSSTCLVGWGSTASIESGNVSVKFGHYIKRIDENEIAEFIPCEEYSIKLFEEVFDITKRLYKKLKSGYTPYPEQRNKAIKGIYDYCNNIAAGQFHELILASNTKTVMAM